MESSKLFDNILGWFQDSVLRVIYEGRDVSFLIVYFSGAMNEYDIFCCFSFLNVAVTPDGRWRRNMLSPNRLKDESLLKKLIFIFVKSLKIFFLGWHVVVVFVV